nr:MAG TPA: hypothetical protein [Caudoviricetes sp.]
MISGGPFRTDRRGRRKTCQTNGAESAHLKSLHQRKKPPHH